MNSWLNSMMGHQLLIFLSFGVGSVLAVTGIEKLADSDFQQREIAEKELWAAGEKSLAALQEAAKNDDPEISFRARRILKYITMELSPDSPPEVIDLVQKFPDASQSQKTITLNRLISIHAIIQALHLSNSEEGKGLLKEAELFVAAEIEAGKVAGDFTELSQLLDLLPDGQQKLIAEASLIVDSSQVDDVLEQLDKGEKVVTDELRFRYLLHAFSGRYPEAEKLAEELGDKTEVAKIRALQGDPKPLFEIMNSARGEQDHKTIRDGLLARWDEGAAAYEKALDKPKEIKPLELPLEPKDRFVAALKGEKWRVLSSLSAENLAAYYLGCEDERALKKLVFDGRDQKSAHAEISKIILQAIQLEEDEEIPIGNEKEWLYFNFCLSHNRQGDLDELFDLSYEIIDSDKDNASERAIRFFNLISQQGINHHGYRFLKSERGRPYLPELKELILERLRLNLKNHKLFLNKFDEIVKEFMQEDEVEGLGELLIFFGTIPATPEKHTKALAKMRKVMNTEDERISMAVFQSLSPRMSISDAADTLGNIKLNPQEPIDEQLGYRMQYYYLLQEDGIQAKKYSTKIQKNTRRVIPEYWKVLAEAFSEKNLKEEGRNRINKAVKSYQLSSFGYQNTHQEWSGIDEQFGFNQLAYKNSVRAFLLNKSRSRSLPRMARGIAEKARKVGEWKVAAAFSLIECGDLESTLRQVDSMSVYQMFQPIGLHFYDKGMVSIEEGKIAEAVKYLHLSVELLDGLGFIADDIMPSIYGKLPAKDYDTIYQRAASKSQATLKNSPDGANTLNSTAWLAARSVKDLDQALEWSKRAVELQPTSAAYLDTMAEVWFAKGDRSKAIEWSEKSLRYASSNFRLNGQWQMRAQWQMWAQHRHFKYDPLPQ